MNLNLEVAASVLGIAAIGFALGWGTAAKLRSGRKGRTAPVEAKPLELDNPVQLLRESEERFRFLLDAMAEIPIQGCDSDRRVIFWNKASQRAYGYSCEEALGQRLEDLIIPLAMRSEVIAATKAYYEEGKQIPAGELELRDNTGKPVHVYSSHILYINEKGGKEMFSIDIDLNQLRRAEDALRKSEERLQLVLKGSNEGWWDWNLVENEMYYSPRWYEMLGYEYLELPATFDLWREFLHPDDRERIDGELQVLLSESKTTYAEVEFRMRHRNGHYFPVMCRGHLQRDSRGDVVRATGLNLDVSERKQNEAILQAQLQLSALVQRGSLAEIQALALERAKALTGSVSGFFIVLPSDTEGITGAKRALLDRFAGECGHGIVHLSGERIAGKLSGVHPMLPVSEALAYPICRNKHLKALLVVGDKPTSYTNRDSQTLQQLADSIWDAIGHKQAEMERRRNQIALERAKAEAERANRAKSDFLATMSHEIRTPLNGVIGMADYMRFLDLTKEQQECVEIIYESGNILLGLIEDILDLSKIEADKLVLHPVEVDLSNELDSLVKLMMARAERAKLILHLDNKLPPGRYYTDITRLRQILINLIGNSIKFTPAGGRIDVSVAQMDPEILRFEVMDTGIGIAEDNIGLLFQPFSQIEDNAILKQSGTGLGLSICKRLAHLLGGEIGVVSKPGQGSTFWFTIAASLERK